MEEENTGNAGRCSAAAYMVFMQGYKVYVCVGLYIVTAECSGLFFFILLCEASEAMTGLLQHVVATFSHEHT